MDDDEQKKGKKDQAPDSKGLQDCPVLKDDDNLRLPEDFDYLAGISAEDSQLLDQIYQSRLPSLSERTSNSHQGFEEDFGDDDFQLQKAITLSLKSSFPTRTSNSYQGSEDIIGDEDSQLQKAIHLSLRPASPPRTPNSHRGSEDIIGNEDSQLQKAIHLSMRPASPPRTPNSHKGSEDVGDSASHKSPGLKRKGISASPPKSTDLKQKGICTYPEPLDYDFGRTSSPGEDSWFKCVICGYYLPAGKMKRLLKCKHRFCEDCMRAYVGRMIGENIHGVKCPHEKCKEILTEEQCCDYLPQEVADRWFEAISEAKALEKLTPIYCPFEDCFAIFVDDERGFLIRACPECWRIFCRNCRVRWHMGLTCHQFQESIRYQMRDTMRSILGPSRFGVW